jgi:methyl-accepting chemotaxis protein
MLNKMKIGPKLIGGFLIVALIAAIVGIVGTMNIKTIGKKDMLLYGKVTTSLVYLGEIGQDFGRLRTNVIKILAGENDAEIKRAQERINKFDASIRETMKLKESTYYDENDRKIFEAFSTSYEEYMKAYNSFLALFSAGKKKEAHTYVFGAFGDIGTKASDLLNENSKSNEAEAKKLSEDNAKTSNSAIIMMISLITLGTLLSVVLGVLLTTSITKPLGKLVKTADAVAQGDMTQNVSITSFDEIGQLQKSVAAMLKNIKEKINILNKIPTPIMAVDKNMSVTFMNEAGASVAGKKPKECEGMKCSDIFKTAHCNTPECRTKQAIDTNVIATGRTVANPNPATHIPIQYTGAPLTNDKGEVVGGLEYVADITEVETMMKETDRVVNAVSACMSAAVDKDLTKNITEKFEGKYGTLVTNVNNMLQTMDHALTQVATATEQVSGASQQISAGSQSLAQGTNEQASSLEEVSSTLEEMSSMTKQNAENADKAKNLSGEANSNAGQGKQAMERMSESINRIKSSSDQTAKIVKTIDEIAIQTNLLALNAAVEAARAGEAGRGFAVVAEEVRNLAQRSSQAAKSTADMIEESVKNAEEGVTIAVEVAKAFEVIAGSNAKVNDLILEIAAASQEQALGIDSVNKSVAQMDKVTQQNAASSEESASAAEELSSQAEELQSMVGQFTLNDAVMKNASENRLQKDAKRPNGILQ